MNVFAIINQRINLWLDRFLFDSCHLQTAALLRIGFAALLLVYTSVWWLDAEVWFSDVGLMSVEAAQLSVANTNWSLFFWLPATPAVVHGCMAILLLNGLLLLFGYYSRIQAAMIFFWLVSFQNRNSIIGDGEDTVFRIFAFFLILIPADYCWSWASWRRRKRGEEDLSTGKVTEAAWGVRLFQLQMAVIYFSAAWCKALGTSWQQGTALYYVYQMGDTFGRGPLPLFLTETEWVIRATTWAVLAVEASLPVLLFLPRTRLPAICLALVLHLSMEYAMHLFLFQWIMMLGILSFTKPADFSRLIRLFRKPAVAASGVSGV
ncbi:MAG: HTTM domain-containing protein [Planctomycetota bacterium]